MTGRVIVEDGGGPGQLSCVLTLQQLGRQTMSDAQVTMETQRRDDVIGRLVNLNYIPLDIILQRNSYL